MVGASISPMQSSCYPVPRPSFPVTVLSLSTLMFLATTFPAMAYVDPGTGSLAIQGLLAAIAGGAIALRRIRMQIVKWFTQLNELFRRFKN